MPDPSTSRDNESDMGLPPRVPRWVKVFATIVVAATLVLAIVQLITGGQHGPGLHTP